MKFLQFKPRIPYLSVFIVVIILTIFAGWLFTDYLGRVAEKEFRADVARDINLDSSYLHDNLNNVESAAKVLGPSEAIVEALASGSSTDLEHANRLLDRIKSSLDLSVCYLLDRNGLTVASSNRNEQSSFVGKNFAFRPFFIDAVAGRLTTYFAIDLISHERGYFAAAPVVDSDGWSIVTMDDPAIVSNYRLFGIFLTSAFVMLLLFFFIVLRNNFKSLEAAKDLLKSKDDWKRTFDAVPDLIAIIDANYRISSMNRAMAERLGISQQEAVGRRCFELLHDSQKPPSSCPHQRMLESGTTESETLFIKAMNGDFIISVAPLMSKEGAMESSIHVMHDISKVRLLERSQKEYAQRLEFVLEGSNDGTWEWDLTTNQGVVNTRYYEMIEFTPGEVDSTFEFFLKTIHPDDVADVQRRVQDYLDGKTNGYEANYRLVTKSGKLKNVLGRGKIVRYDEDGRPLMMAGVVTDISEMKRLSDEVNRINNLESIGLLSGGLAHDFNNVLNIIYGNITFVKMLAEGNADFVEPLRDAEEACERAKELGIRLQAFSQGGTLFRERIALTVLIEDVAGDIFKGSRISHSISAPDAPLPLEADPRQIRQIFENLLTNAKDAMLEDGTVTIAFENCEVDGKNGLSLRSGPYVCITIQDDGSGIPEVYLPKIFDPYFSTKDTYSQRGMGLGLSICHAVMKRHNGQISVESSVGIGTRVTLYLPASVEEKQLTPEG